MMGRDGTPKYMAYPFLFATEKDSIQLYGFSVATWKS